MTSLKTYDMSIFEKIKHIDEDGNEYWLARELQTILGYHQWRSINNLIERAKVACQESTNNIDDHFALYCKMVDIGSKTKRKVQDYRLSRYASYLIVMNGNPNKKIIALAQTYFAYQTRKQELLDEELNNLTEDERRIRIRNEVKRGNYSLNKEAVKSGVKNLAEFTNAGYKGLYNGETADQIFKRKKLNYREDILDYMGSEELAANLFRITQTESKLRRENIDNEYAANNSHYEVGRNIRDAIIKNGGTLPENLPTPKINVREIENKTKK